MNLLEAIKQIAEHTDERQYFMPGKDQWSGDFPVGRSGNLLTEMWRQTAAAQQDPSQTTLQDIRLNPQAVARFLREQPPSKNIEDRRNEPPPPDEPYLVTMSDTPVPDPNDPLAQLLGINSIDRQPMTLPEIMTVPEPVSRRSGGLPRDLDEIPLPRRRPRR